MDDKEREIGRGRPVAAICGASSGFGAIYARRLAERGCDLFLVARRADRLKELADTLSARYGVAVETMAADLSKPDELAAVEERVVQLTTLEYMVNSAGFGGNQVFPDVDIDLETRMIQVHCIATMRLSRAALIPMVAKKSGKIINIASAAGFLAGAGAADYTATKAYIITFSRSLQSDVRRRGVRVQALCPGFARTEFHDSETMKNSHIKEKVVGWLWFPAERVVSISLTAIDRSFWRGVVCIPSLRYKFLAWAGSEWWLAPLRILFTAGSVR